MENGRRVPCAKANIKIRGLAGNCYPPGTATSVAQVCRQPNVFTLLLFLGPLASSPSLAAPRSASPRYLQGSCRCRRSQGRPYPAISLRQHSYTSPLGGSRVHCCCRGDSAMQIRLLSRLNVPRYSPDENNMSGLGPEKRKPFPEQLARPQSPVSENTVYRELACSARSSIGLAVIVTRFGSLSSTVGFPDSGVGSPSIR